MVTVNDVVFGVMEYNHRWVKKEKLPLWSLFFDVNIVAKAYKGKPITDLQRNAYKKFKAELPLISERIQLELVNYLSVDKKKILTMEDLNLLLKLKTILFTQDGNAIMLFDSLLDVENGVGIQIYPILKLAHKISFYKMHT